ncbi:von Willebrand factor type A domain-containing protein [Marinicella sp. W31]|uniref:vWA domain-containing protein n=1 Tax=Marinicella sp. W31 TaxID=3023713 RepID=UPI00375670C2
MKKLILLLIVALLTACASSVTDKDVGSSKQQVNNPKPTDKRKEESDDAVVATEESLAPEPSETNSVLDNRTRPRKVDQIAETEGRQLNHLVKTVAPKRMIPNATPAYEHKFQPPIQDRENYANFEDNPVKRVQEQPVSTFSIDVDTGSYANVRRMLNQGQIPRKDAVRLEEMVNYFNYDYPLPEGREQPFATYTEIAPSPWNDQAHLMHIGIQGYKIAAENRPDANLVFLVDVSGSMSSPDKLGLLKSSLKLLAKNMRANDKISIAVYAGAAGTVLEPTSGDDKNKIISALDSLNAGGSTNGAAGIHLAYQLAEQNLVKDGINRIIIATDGDFNVGTTNFEALKELVERKRKGGVSLTTLGFGTGNYNDHLMEQLADVGNGNHAYIDSIREANKVLINEMNSTLFTIAKDVKIQVEFNPQTVAEYRLVGYENRALKNEDFNNDKIDAGEIGAGHTVTAIYEVILTDANKTWMEPLRYQNNNKIGTRRSSLASELGEIRIRYKQPDSDKSTLTKWTVKKGDIIDFDETSENFRFSAAVAAFGQLLRGGEMIGEFVFEDVLDLSRNAKGADRFGYRGEFIQLVSLADSLIE